MQNESNPNYIPRLEVKNEQYFRDGQPLSNFTLAITKVTRNKDAGSKKFGTVTRRVRFTPGDDELELPAKSMASASAFRCFCLSHGHYVWMGGEKDLYNLIQDMDADYHKRSDASRQNR